MRPNIQPSCRFDGHRLIAGNGIGIPDQYHADIFEIFHKLDENSSGTGIGLAIVRKAIERMGGRIHVRSSEKRGSTFVLELKRA